MSASFPSGRRWADLSPRTRAAVMALGAVQVALGLAAQIDITRRSSGQIRGAPWRWRLVSLINVVGPLTYFRFGRRGPTRR